MAAVPYFYYLSEDGQTFSHGCNIFEIVKKSNIPWKWNKRAINCLAILDLIAGDDSLHKDVKKVPFASILIYRNGKLTIEKDPFWKTSFSKAIEPSIKKSMHNTSQTLERIFNEMSMDFPALSLSAGLDSRLVLAYMLKRGIKPLVITAGWSRSTDVKIAKKIASYFELQHRIVELAPGDYFQHAKKIVQITNGSKPPAHWHTYIYLYKAGLPEQCIHYAGVNGEFARNFYFDKGIVAMLADRVPFNLFRVFHWFRHTVRKTEKITGYDEIPEINGPAEFIDVPRYLELLTQDIPGFLNRLDYYFATQTVRNFIGNGLALYRAVAPTQSAFLDSRWIRDVITMPRKCKLGSYFHRQAINAYLPKLMEFPIDEHEKPISLKPELFYWMNRKKMIGYSAYPEFEERKDLLEMLIESNNLDYLFTKQARMKMLDQKSKLYHKLLISLHYVVELIRDSGIQFC